MTDSKSSPRHSERHVPRTRIRQELHRAIRERGLCRFAIIDTVGEGRFYPNGMEERSGDVMDEDGRVWMFWTAWDSAGGRVTIGDWKEAEVASLLSTTKGYARARRELGLDEGHRAS